MKIVFLDIDGVMNGFETWPANAGRKWIDPMAVSHLNRITDATAAHLVITSTWRRFCHVPALLLMAGVTAQVLGAIPHLPNGTRGDEIAAWLHGTGYPCLLTHTDETFVILDDDSDMGPCFMHRLVKTDWAYGLTALDAQKAIDILGVAR